MNTANCTFSPFCAPYMTNTTAADHEALEWKASLTLPTQYDTLEENLTDHCVIRSKGIVPDYSAIAQERTTIKFLLQGLANHPDFQ